MKKIILSVLSALSLLVFLPEAQSGPDWQQNPICQRMEFPTGEAGDILFDNCRDWISKVKQPVVAGMENQNRGTCCSEADAYEADDFVLTSEEGGQHFAIVTRNYPDVPEGTKIFIPPYKFNLAYEDGNPTGHGIIFMTNYIGALGEREFNVLCYFSPSLQ